MGPQGFRALGRRPEIVHLDAFRLDECGEVAEQLADRLGCVDVFVNNSGPGDSALLVNRALVQLRTVVATDPYGAFVCIQPAVRRMSDGRTGGRIIALTSVHEHQPSVGSAACAASKHGLGGPMKVRNRPHLAGSGVTSACNYELADAEGQLLLTSVIPPTSRRARVRTGARPTAGSKWAR